MAGPAVILNAGVVQDSGGLSDEAIDRAGDQAMNGHEFRSVRRQVLEKVVVEDVDKGFLKETLKSIGEGIRSVFDAIGDFFRWLFGGSGRTKRRLLLPRHPMSHQAARETGDSPCLIWRARNRPDLCCVAAVIFILIALIVKTLDARKKKAEGLLDELGDALADVTTRRR